MQQRVSPLWISLFWMQMLSFPHWSVFETDLGAMLAQTGVRWPKLFPGGPRQRGKCSSDGGDGEISEKIGPLSFLLGVQFFHYGPERSTSGGGDWDRDSTFYYMRRKEVDRPPLREVSLGPSPQLAPPTSLQRFLAKIWTLSTFPTTNASTFVSSQNSPRLAWPPYSDTLKVCP